MGNDSKLDSEAREIDLLRARVDELEQALEAADEAWEGLKQTQLAASAVGVEIAQGLREGYGLNLTIALRSRSKGQAA